MRRQSFQEPIRIGDEVYCFPAERSMKIKNIRVDSLGVPLLDLISFDGKDSYLARVVEIGGIR